MITGSNNRTKSVITSNGNRTKNVITSSSNGQIKNVIQLIKKPKERTAQDLFLVEGPKMFLEVPERSLVKAYLSETFYNKNKKDPKVNKLLDLAPSEVVSDAVFAAISDTKTPQGVVCLVKQFHYQPEDLLGESASLSSGEKRTSSLMGENPKTPPSKEKQASLPSGENRTGGRRPLVMVLENLQDPGNLGTILRTGEGAGVTGILLTKGSVDLYNPKVIRSTMGSVYRMPFVYSEDAGALLKKWKDSGMQICAAHLDGKLSYDEEDYQKPTAFLIGNESKGLTDEMASMADHLIRIPMLGQVESLNAAVAGAVLMYEAARQRRVGVKTEAAR